MSTAREYKKLSSIEEGAKKGRQPFVGFMAVATLLAGLATLASGVMGFYWGTAVIKPWPPLTWNNCVGGFFMIVFGIAVSVVGLNQISFENKPKGAGDANEAAGQIQKYAGFLDSFAGRGIFFCYLGLRIMPLGKYYCLIAGLSLMFFGFGNIVIHFVWTANTEDAMKTINYLSTVIGAIVCVAGGMGFYWGTKIIKPWPPLTWNNCVGGIFMFVFGVMIVMMINIDGDKSSWISKYLMFLDTLIGRGLFFMFVGLRIVPLGQFYCLVAGMVTFSTGVLLVAIHWIHNDSTDGGPIRISTTKKVPDFQN